MPAEPAGEREGAADQETHGSASHRCGKAELKQRGPRGRRMNVQADEEPDDRPDGAG